MASADEVRDDDVVRLTSELIRIDTTNRGGGDCLERPAAEYVAAQLAEVGITMEIEKMPIADFVTRWLAPDFTAAIALNGGRPDADGMYGRYFTSTGNLNKVAGYSSEELDALFAQGRAEQDPAERKKIYAEVSTNLEQNAPWIWLFTSYTYTASTNTVGGFIPMANGSVQGLRDVTLD